MIPRTANRGALTWASWLLVAAIALGASAPARAIAIGPGFDLFHTPVFSFDVFGTGMPIMLMGRAIGPGNTDTIVERTMGLPAGEMGDIPIELVALSLESASPVNIMGSFFDVFVTLDASMPSLGMIKVTSHDDAAGGGTFDSFFDVFYEIQLTEVGGTGMLRLNGTLHLENMGATWSHTPPPGYPMERNYPSGDFYPGPIPHMGAHPVVPAAEPSTAILLGAGLLGAAAARRSMKRG